MESSRQQRIVELALKKMAAKPAAAATAAAAERTFTHLHEAAAVVATFQVGDLHKLDASPRDVDVLLADSIPAQDPAGSGGWTLAPQIRGEILSKMTLPRLQELLERGVLAAAGDSFRSALQQLPSLDSLNTAQLASISPFAPALKTAFPSLPERDELERRLENLRLLEPFERLVGHFAGRQKQLGELRDYVEVLPPSSILAAGARLWSKVFKKKSPLLLHAAGGAGKSTLIAQFILEHARLPESERFPFAYLDFDRPALLASEPATILVEAVRQIGLQYPAAYHQGERLRAAWAHQIDKSARRRGSSSSSRSSSSKKSSSKKHGSADTSTRSDIIREFAQFLTTLEVIEGPLLLVLDTFEEVQYLGKLYVKELGKFLSQLSAAVPRLRTVISGRVEVKDISFAKKMPLPDFDEPAAIGFLSANGVSDPAFAKTIVKQFGGNPLTLLLAAQVAQTEEGRKELASIATTRAFGLVPVAMQHIQGQLFERILKHVHRDDVRQIAYPGLVLRRVTPEIIREVLAGPCGIPIPTLAEAKVLFRELKREEALVSSGGGEVLIPRTDVRRLMLRSVRDTKPRETKKIDENAVAYYAKRSDPASRAEEIYHRLFLGEDHESIGTRFIDGVEEYLRNAMEELQTPEKVFLADRLEIDLPDDVIADVPDQLWERSAERRVREALDVDDAEAALEILAERKERTGKTLLYVQDVLAHAAAGQLDKAAKIAQKARAAYDEEGNVIGIFETLLAAAEVDRRLQRFDDALQKLADAGQLAAASHDALQNVRVLVGRALVLTDRREDTAAVRKEISRFAAKISDEVWSEEPVLLRLAAASAGIDDPKLLARAVRIAYPTGVLPRQWGAIASLLGRSGDMQDVLEQLETGEASQELRAFVADVLRNDTRTAAPDPAFPAAEAAKVNVRATLEERKELVNTLLSRFPTRDDLDRFLSDNFARQLDTLSLAKDLRSSVAQVVDHAERGQWLAPLVEVLRRDSEPGLEGLVNRSGLGAVAENLGPGAMSVDELRRLARSTRRLTEIEGRMCRIEAGGKLIKTGFLVDNNVVLTSGAEVPIGASARFDYAEADGHVVLGGTLVRIIEVIPVPPDMRPQTILLRLDRPIGHEPIFGARDVGPRRYFDLREAHDDMIPLRVVWLWYEGGLKLGGAEKVLDADRDVMRFSVRPRTAFEGAPCFDMGLNLVALHCGEDPHTGECIARSVLSIGEHAKGILRRERR